MAGAHNVVEELLPLFQSECEDRLNSISEALARVEESSSAEARADILDALLRELHSLKGGARAVNLASVEALSHAFEQLLVRIQHGELDWHGEVFDACHNSVEVLSELILNPRGGGDGEAAGEVVALLERLQPAPPRPAAAPAVEDTAVAPEERELLQRLLPIFRAEADERLESIAGCLDELGGSDVAEPRRHELHESIMRDAHSIKGGARTMKLSHVGAVAQKFEHAAGQLCRGEVRPSAEVYDLFGRAAAIVRGLLESPGELNEGLVNQVIEDLATIDQGAPAGAAAPLPAGAPVARPQAVPRGAHTVRVATERLDSVLRHAQEMLAGKLTMRQRGAELRELAALLREWQMEWSRVDTDVYRLQSWVEKHDEHSDPAGIYHLAAGATRFLEWSQKTVRSLEKQVRELSRRLFEDQQSFGVAVDALLDETKKAVMLPLSTLFKGLPRMVREVARTQKKAIDFEVVGDDVEVDKRIIDELRDPLMHLLRNCVDHGIEASGDRQANGKPRRGRLRIEVAQTAADQVQVVVADDGRGIDTERLRLAAVHNGVLTDAQSRLLARDELLQLIFRSGVSTSDRVSNISGRGLGMAICREGIERLGGTIGIDSRSGHGTSFRIVVPVAMATYRVLLLEVGRHVLAVPTASAERVVRLASDAVTPLHGRDTISDRGAPIVLQQLDVFLGLESGAGARGSRPIAVILRSGNRRVAFAVSRVTDEQEVLFKDLGSYLVHVPNVSGATILGTGTVVPILNVPEMIDAVYAENVTAAAAAESVAEEPAVARQRAILVVEDSITSRMLLKEILESAGYAVATAVNGAEAVSELARERFDLVVSDVEMPRMNGFELTEYIRADERWARLPVILVTGLERPEQRQRGLAAGADEYIVKGSFEQSSLLEAIGRLCGEA
jgi:two-component system, chemotaxis family, sensor kinase CheA